jgi:hypothetical protein
LLKTNLILTEGWAERQEAAARFVLAAHLLGQLVPDIDTSQVYEGTAMEYMTDKEREQSVRVVREVAFIPDEAKGPEQILAALVFGEVEFDTSSQGFQSTVSRLLGQ